MASRPSLAGARQRQNSWLALGRKSSTLQNFPRAPRTVGHSEWTGYRVAFHDLRRAGHATALCHTFRKMSSICFSLSLQSRPCPDQARVLRYIEFRRIGRRGAVLVRIERNKILGLKSFVHGLAEVHIFNNIWHHGLDDGFRRTRLGLSKSVLIRRGNYWTT